MRVSRLCVALVVLASARAHADGGYFPIPGGVAETADQRAVIIDHGDVETLVLQTGHDGDASGFAWVIPVPTRLVGASAVGTADPGVFRSLNDLTAPQYFSSTGGTSGLCGCAGSGGSGADGAPMRGDVTVWDAFSVDSYDIAILSAQESESLATWLADNGYGLPAGAAPVLQHYVGKQWYFVAMKIAPEAPGGGAGGEEFRPLTLTFATDELVFPMHISRVSTTDRVEVLLYVLAEHRVSSSNYATAEIQARSMWRGDSFEAVYDGWFEDTITAAGGTALVVEYAGELPTWWVDAPPFDSVLEPGRSYYVTRLRTRLRPAQMSEDIVMVAAARDDDLEVVVSSGAIAVRAHAAAVAMLLACVEGVALRRWSFGRRLASATALLAIFIVLL